MSKFHVGDTVIGNKLADSEYLITTYGWKGSGFKVKEQCFDICDEAKSKKLMTERWVRCPGCQHKLFKLEELGDSANAVISIKCHSCKNVIKVNVDHGWVSQSIDA